MQYEEEQKERKGKYHSAAGKKKKLTREDFKKDLTDAVKEGLKAKKGKAKKAGGKGYYEGMKVSELRALLNQKKNALLTKAGFPQGKLPRSRTDMIALCKKLKRKRW